MSEEGKTKEEVQEQGIHQSLMEFAPWPMAQVDGPQHTLYAMNEAFATLLGKERQELLGEPLDELLKGDKYCVPLMKRVLKTGKWESYTESASVARNSLLRRSVSASSLLAAWSFVADLSC